MTDTSRNKLSAATNKVIDNSNYVTRQKIMNANPGSRYKTIFLQADFTRTNTEKVLKISFPLAPSLKFLSLSEKYKIYYTTDSEAVSKGYSSQVKYRSPVDNSITLHDVNQGSKLWLKIVYAQEGKEDQLTMKEAYQCLSFTQFDFDQNSFGTYDFEFNKEYITTDQKVSSLEKTNKNLLLIRSYNEDNWTEKSQCKKCSSSELVPIPSLSVFKTAYEAGKLQVMNGLQQIEIPYKCSQCSQINYFQPKQTETGMACPLGHEFSAIKNREQISMRQTEMCYFCQTYGIVMFRDRECGISICEFCRSQFGLME